MLMPRLTGKGFMWVREPRMAEAIGAQEQEKQFKMCVASPYTVKFQTGNHTEAYITFETPKDEADGPSFPTENRPPVRTKPCLRFWARTV